MVYQTGPSIFTKRTLLVGRVVQDWRRELCTRSCYVMLCPCSYQIQFRGVIGRPSESTAWQECLVEWRWYLCNPWYSACLILYITMHCSEGHKRTAGMGYSNGYRLNPCSCSFSLCFGVEQTCKLANTGIYRPDWYFPLLGCLVFSISAQIMHVSCISMHIIWCANL